MKFPSFRLLALASAAPFCLGLSACVADDESSPKTPPQVSYAGEYRDTVGVAVSHAPASVGGEVLRFRVSPRLPDGLELDTLTGVISGTPEEEKDGRTYRVIATGKDGADTASFSLEVIDTSAAAEEALVSLSLALEAAQGYTLSKLIVEHESDAPSDAIVRDTLVPGTAGLVASANSDQTIGKSYSLRALRSWKIRVRALDVNDSTLYRDSVQVSSLLIGETRAVALALEPRYRTYLAKFTFPDSMGTLTGTFRSALRVNRLTARVNGFTARDSSTAGGAFFAASPVTHNVAVPYLAAGSNASVRLVVGGQITGYADSLYAGTFSVVVDSSGTRTPVLAFMGPHTGVEGLTVSFAPFATVSIDPGLPPAPLPKKKN